MGNSSSKFGTQNYACYPPTSGPVDKSMVPKGMPKWIRKQMWYRFNDGRFGLSFRWDIIVYFIFVLFVINSINENNYRKSDKSGKVDDRRMSELCKWIFKLGDSLYSFR